MKAIKKAAQRVAARQTARVEKKPASPLHSHFIILKGVLQCESLKV